MGTNFPLRRAHIRRTRPRPARCTSRSSAGTPLRGRLSVLGASPQAGADGVQLPMCPRPTGSHHRRRPGRLLRARRHARSPASRRVCAASPATSPSSSRSTRCWRRSAGAASAGSACSDPARLHRRHGGPRGEFDRSFRPPSADARRWERIAQAQRRGESLPPISVYRVGDLHFVEDGHHRVSVARALGPTHIDAYVTEVSTELRRRRPQLSGPPAQEPRAPVPRARAAAARATASASASPTRGTTARWPRASRPGASAPCRRAAPMAPRGGRRALVRATSTCRSSAMLRDADLIEATDRDRGLHAGRWRCATG